MADPDEGAQEPDAAKAGGAEGAAPPSGDGSGAGMADAAVPDLEIPEAETVVPDPEIPDADVPELDQREPVIPDPVLPESFLTEPVIPPPPEDTPVTGADWREKWRDRSGLSGSIASGAEGDEPAGASPVTRAARRAASDPVTAPPVPASDPRLTAPDPDPAVVPPPSGATSGGYRGLTIAIYGVLGALLVGAVVMISTLLR